MACDDVRVELKEGKVITHNACLMGDAKFQENTAKQADLYVKVRPGYDIPLFNAMRAMLRGHELNEFTEEVTGVDVKTIKKLMDMLLDSEFVGAFIGLGLASSRGKDKNACKERRGCDAALLCRLRRTSTTESS